jgi:predicted ATP-binding protein involved in virulence
MPMFKNPRSQVRPLCFLVDWQINQEETKTLRIEQLSDGYRTTLAMIMDIAARMASANPELKNPLETEGIILIDEVELHLHPGWQQTILPPLLETFPNVQFIVTTHSPQVLTTVPSSSIKAIQWDSSEQPNLMPSIEFSEGAESQQLLEDILGIKPRPQNIDIVKKLNRYLELISLDKWDSTEAKALRSKLDKWGQGYETALANADIDIRLRLRRLGRKHEENQ